MTSQTTTGNADGTGRCTHAVKDRQDSPTSSLTTPVDVFQIGKYQLCYVEAEEAKHPHTPITLIGIGHEDRAVGVSIEIDRFEKVLEQLWQEFEENTASPR